MNEERLKSAVIEALREAQEWPHSQSMAKAKGNLILLARQFMFDGRLSPSTHSEINTEIEKIAGVDVPNLWIAKNDKSVFRETDYQNAIDEITAYCWFGESRKYLGRKDTVPNSEKQRIADLLEAGYQKSKKTTDKGKKIDAYSAFINSDDKKTDLSKDILRKYWRKFYPKR